VGRGTSKNGCVTAIRYHPPPDGGAHARRDPRRDRDVRSGSDYRDHTRLQRLDEPYVLETGCTIHGITRERISLPPDLCGFLEGRSRFARLGLMVHVTSAFVQPGVSNRQVLEMSNVAGQPLRIHPGVRLCQLVLMRTDGKAVYRGRFADQDQL
jgi:dCTP deaminase